ncbi:MAG: release factor glutamine methyltransferase [Pseudomonadota bacterium]|jgi:release factor glutamine methyltransferase
MTPPSLSAAFDRQLDLLSRRLQILPDKPQETPAATLRVLWHLAAGQALSVEAAEAVPLAELDTASADRLDALIEQRASGVPLAHLSGRQRFMGLDMLAGKEALIPRHETELLGETGIGLLREVIAAGVAAPRVMDICTGSGNLALALAHHVPTARVFASDLSEEAVALAGRNAVHLGLNDRVQFRAGDLLEPFNEAGFHASVDVMLCNPPYISSGKVDTLPEEIGAFEPRLAFDGGPLGVRILQRLIREAPLYLRPGAWLAFEVGLGQGPAVLKRLIASGGFAAQRAVNDARGEMRVIVAQRA